MSILKRWTGTEWETIGMGVSADVNEFSAVASVNGLTGTVTINSSNVAYSSTGSYSYNTIGQAVQDLTTATTPIILNENTLFPQVVMALNSGRPVYADVASLRHQFVFRETNAANGLRAIFVAVNGPVISTVTYSAAGGMTRTVTDIGDTNYWATFGTTTNAEINTAINNNKTIKCQIANLTYNLNYNDSSENIAFFTSTVRENGNLIIYWLQVSNDSWTSGLMSIPANLANDVADLKSDLGDLADLETEDKSSIVNAINEARRTGGSGGGLTEDIKQALLNCFENVAWIDSDGQTYYDALEEALHPPTDLVSISAVYTQSGTVYDMDSLDSLKADLVVTATYSDSSTATVPSADYTLSGTLASGTSTITVSYGGKTDTFTVTVTSDPHLLYSLKNRTFTGTEEQYIDTGINLFAQDIDYTITCDLTQDDVMGKIGWRILTSLQTASPWNGFYYGSPDTTTRPNARIKWIYTTKDTTDVFSNTFIGRHRAVFTHEKGTGVLNFYYRNNNDSLMQDSVSATWSALVTENLHIGGVGDQTGYNFVGHVNSIAVYDYVFTSDEINAFAGVS